MLQKYAVNPRFLSYLIALAISKIGDNIYLFGVPLIVLQMTGSAAKTGVTYAVEFLPIFVLGPVIGVLTDRLDRRTVLVVADLLRALLVGLIPLLNWLDALQLWHLYVISFTLSTLSMFYDTAMGAAVPLMVTQEELPRANAASQLVTQAGSMAGPVVAGAVIAALGYHEALVLDSISFAGTFLVALLLFPALRPASRTAGQSLVKGISAGFRFVWENRVIRALSIQAMTGNLATTMVYSVLLYHLTKQLGLTEVWVGLTYTVIGIGGLAGSLVVVPLMARFPRGRLYPAILSLGIVGMLILTLVKANFAPALGMGMVSATIIAWVVMTAGVRQEVVPLDMLGRVLAFGRILSTAMMPLGAVLAGFLTEQYGTIVVFGLATLFKVLDVLIALLSPVGRIDIDTASTASKAV